MGREIDDEEEEIGMKEVTFKEHPIAQLATGKSHVIALDTNGEVYVWGKND